MILDNRTRYRSADLTMIILGALAEAGIEHHGRDRVVVVYGSGVNFSGSAYLGKIRRWNGCARMRLRLPRPDVAFDFPQFVWLVRHEVGHWRGLNHSQMADSLLHWKRGLRKRLGPVGSELPLPFWAADLSVAVEDVEPEPNRKARPTADVVREAKLEHARAMLAKAERKAKIAATLEKRWRRRLLAAERAIRTAAARGDR